jgi:hypothetical protein
MLTMLYNVVLMPTMHAAAAAVLAESHMCHLDVSFWLRTGCKCKQHNNPQQRNMLCEC